MQEALQFLTAKDSILESIIENFGHPIIQKRDEGFASMCHIILEQQVSIASAKACYDKLQKSLGSISPETILEATEESLRTCGLSRQKTTYLKDLATRVQEKTIDFTSFATKSEVQIREELLQIKGVGNWSIEVYLMFCLQSPDIIPLGDIAIKHTLKELYTTTTPEEMHSISTNWAPYRTVASFTLWHYYLKKRNKI